MAFISNQLYAVLAGAGCSHGVPSKPNALLRIDHGEHEANYIANLSHFLMIHSVKNPEPADFEPDGTWYGMVAAGKSLYAVEPNHGELDKITPQDDLNDSTISRVVDISASQGHIVPTAVTFHDGNFYVGNLDTFPNNGLFQDSLRLNLWLSAGGGTDRAHRYRYERLRLTLEAALVFRTEWNNGGQVPFLAFLLIKLSSFVRQQFFRLSCHISLSKDFFNKLITL